MTIRSHRVLVAVITLIGTNLLLADEPPSSDNSATTNQASRSEERPVAGAPATPAPAAQPKAQSQLSPGVDEIVKLVKSGVELKSVLAFIESSPFAYRLTAEELIHLHQIGIPSEVTAALLRHGQTLREQMVELARQSRLEAERARETAPAVNLAQGYSPPAPVSPAERYLQSPVSYAAYPAYDHQNPQSYSYLYQNQSYSYYSQPPFAVLFYSWQHPRRGPVPHPHPNSAPQASAPAAGAPSSSADTSRFFRSTFKFRESSPSLISNGRSQQSQ